jgi:hypothetical protein
MTELHFSPPREFYDVFNKTSFSSLSRATAFLWLCWHYLETDGSPEAATKNPFGPPAQEFTVRCPKLQHITVEQEEQENLDPEEELEYGQRMEEERKRISFYDENNVGYLDNEQWLKENPSAEKPVKKARGGVASRKAKANSIALHAARASKPKTENETATPIPEEASRNSTPSKAGDISFVLNGPSSPPRSTPTKSPNGQAVKMTKPAPTSVPLVELPPPSVPAPAPAEPAHNRISREMKLN